MKSKDFEKYREEFTADSGMKERIRPGVYAYNKDTVFKLSNRLSLVAACTATVVLTAIIILSLSGNVVDDGITPRKTDEYTQSSPTGSQISKNRKLSEEELNNIKDKYLTVCKYDMGFEVEDMVIDDSYLLDNNRIALKNIYHRAQSETGPIYIYHDDIFTNINDSYEEGLVSAEEVYSIGIVFNSIGIGDSYEDVLGRFEDNIPSATTPSTTTPSATIPLETMPHDDLQDDLKKPPKGPIPESLYELDNETMRKLGEEFVMSSEHYDERAGELDYDYIMTKHNYYVMSNDRITFKEIQIPGLMYPDVVGERTMVGGYLFDYDPGNGIIVYYNEKFVSIKKLMMKV